MTLHSTTASKTKTLTRDLGGDDVLCAETYELRDRVGADDPMKCELDTVAPP